MVTRLAVNIAQCNGVAIPPWEITVETQTSRDLLINRIHINRTPVDPKVQIKTTGASGKAVLSQWEVGVGFVPGGGPMARLPRLMGRGKALEVFLRADDVDGDLAQLYGYVNRSLPDSELDGFVDKLAWRVAPFEKPAIAETKRLVNLASLPSDEEISPEWNAFIDSAGSGPAQARIGRLLELGLHQPGDVENRLGHYLGPLDRQ